LLDPRLAKDASTNADKSAETRNGAKCAAYELGVRQNQHTSKILIAAANPVTNDRYSYSASATEGTLVVCKFVISIGIWCLLLLNASAETFPQDYAQLPAASSGHSTEILTDAAVIAVIIAASISAYKALGKPCACPDDTMRNGKRCGGNSAWSRPGGYKPLCYTTDVTAAMIKAYRATNAIPPLQ
jgi:hypothetical protein